MVYKPKILAFSGSLRKESFNTKLLKIAIKGVEEAGGVITYIDLGKLALPLYNQDVEEQKGLPEPVIALKKLMVEHDGFLIASPEHNSGFSSALKNMIDWTSRQASPDEVYLSAFIDKVAVLMSASPGQLGGLRGLYALREVLTNIFTIVLPQQKCIGEAHLAFDEKGNLKKAGEQKAIEALGKRLVDYLITCKG